MLDKITQSTRQWASNSTDIIPDPWEEDVPAKTKSVHPAWQFPLDPVHEISAAPALDGILSPQGDPTALQIPAHTSLSEPTPTEVLLQEELKINAAQAKNLWDHIRDVLALLWWRGPQEEQST